jgi:hypothetical protein
MLEDLQMTERLLFMTSAGIVEYPDPRIKPLVHTMVSSGIRLETWNYLLGSHIKPIEQGGKMVAART